MELYVIQFVVTISNSAVKSAWAIYSTPLEKILKLRGGRHTIVTTVLLKITVRIEYVYLVWRDRKLAWTITCTCTFTLWVTCGMTS